MRIPPAYLVCVVLILCRHLMFRDGLLSPRSKLLPGGGSATLSLYIEEDENPGKRANSVLSLASTGTPRLTRVQISRP